MVYSVAKEIELSNKAQNLGVSMIKEVASKTNNKAGDGTTATVLARANAKERLKLVETGLNLMEIKRGMEKATDDVVYFLKKIPLQLQIQK